MLENKSSLIFIQIILIPFIWKEYIVNKVMFLHLTDNRFKICI